MGRRTSWRVLASTARRANPLKQITNPDDLTSMIGNVSQLGDLSTLIRQAEIRHSVISSNLANVNTPGYKCLDATFADVFASARGSHDETEPVIAPVTGLSARQDGNNVDLEKELGKLTKNALAIQTWQELLAARVGMYRSAISG